MKPSIEDYQHIFFIGVAGAGMSAIAQYLAGVGKQVSGSDRYFEHGQAADIRKKLEAEGIRCFNQDGNGISENTQLIVVSTAIEPTVPEVQKAMQMKIPILKRSEVLALIAKSRPTIAVGGTSGKSTTSGMLFSILQQAKLDPGIISGAGLMNLIKDNKIGNAHVGDKKGWLIIEADESDGSIVLYEPEVGLLLNIDKDHQEIETLMEVFTTFKHHTKKLFVTNQNNEYCSVLSISEKHDFSTNPSIVAGYVAHHFSQTGWSIHFIINGQPFTVHAPGAHNMENAIAAVAVANQLGVSMNDCAKGLEQYEGIYRRHQLLGIKNGITVIDDYGHNPVKCAASIKACQPVGERVIAWFQPHGYGPTKFLRDDFIKEISEALRDEDEIWMSEIFYAGGTAEKTISASDLIQGILKNGKKAFFIPNRNDLLSAMRPHLHSNCVILLMGARDPGLETFAKNFYQQL